MNSTNHFCFKCFNKMSSHSILQTPKYKEYQELIDAEKFECFCLDMLFSPY